MESKKQTIERLSKTGAVLTKAFSDVTLDGTRESPTLTARLHTGRVAESRSPLLRHRDRPMCTGKAYGGFRL